MNGYWLLAFVITPAIVVIGGWVALRLHERSLRSTTRRNSAATAPPD